MGEDEEDAEGEDNDDGGGGEGDDGMNEPKLQSASRRLHTSEEAVLPA
jgi:hypothetical protein